MKRKISLILCVLIVCMSCLSFTVMAEMKGSGTAGDPFVITTPEEFEAIITSPATHYVLGNDITLDFYTTKTNFKGTLDGDGHTITINNGTAPLFDYTTTVSTAKFTDLKLSGNVTLSDWDKGILLGSNRGATVSGCESKVVLTTSGGNVGVFVGRNYSGTVEKCVNKGSVSFGSQYSGGIVGYLQNGTITLCGNEGNITASNSSIGGIVGRFNSGTVEKSYNTGTIESTDSSKSNYAGIAAYISTENLTISNCFNTGRVTGLRAGGILGYNLKTTGEIKNCYSIMSSAPASIYYSAEGTLTLTNCYFISSATGTAKEGSSALTEEQFKDTEKYAENFVDWDFENVWTFNKEVNNTFKYPQLKEMTFNDEYPEGTENNPIKITDAESFKKLEGSDKHFIIATDNLELTGNYAISSFSGILEGNGKTITLTNGTSSLFTELKGTVRNLTTTGNVSLTAAKSAIYAGINKGTIENCVNTAELTTTNTHNAVFAGWNSGATVTKCFNYKDINFGQKYSGAIVGYNTGTVSYCGNTGNITAGSINIGGIIGQQEAIVLEYCYNTGNVTGSYNIGGIVGNLNIEGARISNCFNEGKIKSNNANTSPAGGIAGIIGKTNTEISNCYNAGTVYSRNTNCSVSSAMHYPAASGIICVLSADFCLAYENAGNAMSGVTALTEEKMKDKNEFKGWDFEKIWTMNPVENNSYKYPQLMGMTFEIPYEIGEEGNPILITGIEDFKAIEGSDKAFRITADEITLSDDFSIESFSGSLDGNGKTIVLKDKTTSVFQSLETGAKVKNINLKGNVSLTAERTGALAGTNSGTISDVKNYAEVSSSVAYSGGIAGQNFGTIEKTVNYADISFTKSNGGGIVAYNNGKLKECGNEGNITNTAGSGSTGGIAGISYYSVSGCYNTGNVSAGDGVGGIVGRLFNNGTSITDCYNTGNIIASSAKTAGGIIGGIGNYENISLTDCYNAGAVMRYTVDKTSEWAIYGSFVNQPSLERCFYLASETTEEGGIQGIVKSEFDKKVEAFNVILKGIEDLEKPVIYSGFDGTINVLVNKNNFGGSRYYETWNKPVILSFADISYGVSGYGLTGMGFVISKSDASPELAKEDCKNIPAEYITTKGKIGVMGYGEYIVAGDSYYVRPYAKYTCHGEDYIVYGDTKSFTSAVARP